MTKRATSKRTAKDVAGYVLDDQVGYLLRLANQRHTAIFQELMSNPLTPTQFAALVRLAEVGPCSQNHLGRLTAMDVATIKGVIDRLRARDLLVLAPDPDDRRRTSISLSEQGRALVEAVKPVGLEISGETLAPLSPSERETFLRLLRKLT